MVKFHNSILNIKKISDRLMHPRLVIGKDIWNIEVLMAFKRNAP